MPSSSRRHSSIGGLSLSSRFSHADLAVVYTDHAEQRLSCPLLPPVQKIVGAEINGTELGPLHHLGAGYVAGAIMVFTTNPVWMIKTRMQLQDNTAKTGAVRPYAGLMGESPPLFMWFAGCSYVAEETACCMRMSGMHMSCMLPVLEIALHHTPFLLPAVSLFRALSRSIFCYMSLLRAL